MSKERKQEKAQGAEPEEGFFEPSFIAELEDLAGAGPKTEAQALSAALQERLMAFTAPAPGSGQDRPLSEDDFVGLSGDDLTSRLNDLLALCRESSRKDPVEAVDNFIVFFRTLLPTLGSDGTHEIQRVFFRLVPTLIHIAFNDFGSSAEKRRDGRNSLRDLERVLIEISSIRLSPGERDLVFRSIDQMTGFISAGEYTMASDVISSQLLSILARNRVARALYRLMEVEVSLQAHLQERLGAATPRIRIPEDVSALEDYAPLRIFQEEAPDGVSRRFIQVQIPGISDLRCVVLHALCEDTGTTYDLRLDALGSAELRLPDGAYRLGLAYEPEDS